MLMLLSAFGVSTVLLDEENTFLPPPLPQHDEVYANYAVACDHHLASRAADILAQGGTRWTRRWRVVHAVRRASPVVRHWGGGFMMLHIPEQAPVFMDYREMCPQAMVPRITKPMMPQVPATDTTPCGARDGGGLRRMNLGSLERPDVLAPAIRIARRREADATVHAVGEFLAGKAGNLQAWAGSLWTDVMGEGGGSGYPLVNEPQAKALELIAESGTFAFEGHWPTPSPRRWKRAEVCCHAATRNIPRNAGPNCVRQANTVYAAPPQRVGW